MRIHKSILVFVLVSLLSVGFTNNAIGQQSYIDRYVNKYKQIATDLSFKYGIPASVIIGIAVVESSCGAGKAAKVLNNHFGITDNKSSADKKYKTRYKEYADARKSYEDFCHLVARKKFYSDLKNNPDYNVWIKKLSESGYSEAPAVWQSRIIHVIADNKL